MVRLLAASAVLACALSAWGAPLTRWTTQPVEGASRVISGGPGNAGSAKVNRIDLTHGALAFGKAETR